MSAKEKQQFLADITKMVFSTGQERSIKRLYVTGSGVYTDFDFKMFDNSLFRSLDNLLFTGNNKKLDTGFAIIDLSFTDNKMKKVDSREAGKQGDNAKTNIHRGLKNKFLIDKDLKKNELTGELDYEKGEGYVMIGMGDLSYGIGISRNTLPLLGGRLAGRLENWRNTYTDAKYDKIHKTLQKVFNNTFSKKKY